jgi:peptidoglycan/xylan/chitin deacetylase (PgdA/CDA1 family)
MIALSLCCCSVRSDAAGGGREILVILRYDDFSSRSNTGLELKIIRALSERRMSATFAVIPYVCARDYLDTGRQGVMPLTSEKAAILREAIKTGAIEVAQHGCTHQTVRAGTHGGYSEFSGLDYRSQATKIAQGRKLLERMFGGNAINTFVPPFNSYDSVTLRVLDRLGFACLSANRFGPSVQPSALRYLPETCDLPRLKSTVEAAAHAPGGQAVITVMFHEYDFIEVGGKRGTISFGGFTGLLDWLGSRRDVRVMSVARAEGEIRDLGPQRYADNREYCRTCRLLPAFFGGPPGTYLISSDAIKARQRLLFLAVMLYIAAFWTAGIAAFLCGRISSLGRDTLRACLLLTAAVFLALIILYALGLKSPGPVGNLVVVALLGAGTGMCAAYVIPGKNRRGGGDAIPAPGSGGRHGRESL